MYFRHFFFEKLLSVPKICLLLLAIKNKKNFYLILIFNKTTFKPKTNLMELKNAMAGTLESGDILIQIAPSDVDGLHIELDSTVAYQFGEQIKKVIINTLTELGITKANVKATDKGALDCTIKARVTAAAVRSTGVDVWA